MQVTINLIGKDFYSKKKKNGKVSDDWIRNLEFNFYLH